MKLLKTTSWDEQQCLWGYQIRVDYFYDDGRIFNEKFIFEKEDEKEITQKIQETQEKIETPEITDDVDGKISSIDSQISALQSEKTNLITSKTIIK